MKPEQEENFNNLPVYLHNLRQINPHTHTHIKTDLMDRFQSCFLAIRWVVHAFINFFFPVIFIGSVHHRGNYLKTMFVAVAKDGNKLTFPIAFGMVVENNLVSCSWFLMRLKESVGQGREVPFISNMDDVVSSCVDNVFTNSYHGYTFKSFNKYLRTRVGSGRSLETLFWITSKSYTMSIFEQNVFRLSHDACDVLTNIEPISLSFVGMYSTWKFLNIFQYNRLINVMEFDYCTNTVCSNGASKKDAKVCWLASNTNPQQISSSLLTYVYLVFDFKTTCVLDLNDHTCSCGKWHSLDITCCHVITAARHSNMHELVDAVQVYYHADVFQLVYQTQTVHPLPPPSEWEIPDPLMVVLLPM
uniref:SWIM-type domain-containing protein n=1 Tax=Lactuca sativa TaxID=4236 RepID=A0A9R1W7J3_LACSA|nr:hypothetical protein LSAT_V11C300117200 [Lactuca sativa]